MVIGLLSRSVEQSVLGSVVRPYGRLVARWLGLVVGVRSDARSCCRLVACSLVRTVVYRKCYYRATVKTRQRYSYEIKSVALIEGCLYKFNVKPLSSVNGTLRRTNC